MNGTINELVNDRSSNATGDGRPTVERMLRECLDAVLAPAQVITLTRIQLDAARTLSQAYRHEAACHRVLGKAAGTNSSTLIEEAEDGLDAAADSRAQAEAAFLLHCGSLVVEVQP